MGHIGVNQAGRGKKGVNLAAVTHSAFYALFSKPPCPFPSSDPPPTKMGAVCSRIPMAGLEAYLRVNVFYIPPFAFRSTAGGGYNQVFRYIRFRLQLAL